MGSIVIKLNPQNLTNPDADLRYLIPDKIAEKTLGKVTNNGYDYLNDEVSSLAIFLQSAAPQEDVISVCDILRSNIFKGNQIYEAAELFVSAKTDAELEACDYDLSVYEQII